MCRFSASGGVAELVIILHAPTSITELICRSHLARGQAVKFRHSKAKTLGGALNAGLALCEGEFVARHDSDDLMLADRLIIQQSLLRDNPDLVVVGGQILRIVKNVARSKSYLPLGHRDIVGLLLKGGHAINHGSAMLRRATLENMGGYWDEGLSEDTDLFLRLSERGQLCNVDRAVTGYRFHDDSTTAQHLYHSRLGIELARENHRRRQKGRGELVKSDLYADSNRVFRERARRTSTAQLLYRKSLGRRTFSVFRLLYLARAAALDPSTAWRRIRGGICTPSTPLPSQASDLTTHS